ncbi:uncharacterized protein LOC116467901 [Hylobates moloch]|uniref:uncharacterized protein LOC116467901 n=1 Tax=Hylobates moloch TaxID=81572 RepID=UPI002676D40B|nr:uncharacterized protein LOC116467901 [Hylobates moloch]
MDMLDSPEAQSQSLRFCTSSKWGHSSWPGNSRAYSNWTGSRMTHSLRSSSRACSSWTGSRMTHSLRNSSRTYSSWIGSSHKSHSPPWSPHRSHSPPWSPHKSHSPSWSPHRSHSWSRNRLAHSSIYTCSSRRAYSSWNHSPHSWSHSPHSRSHSPHSRSHSPHSQSHSPHSRSHSLQSSHSSPWFWWVEGGAGRGAGEREMQVWSFLSLGPLYPCPGSVFISWGCHNKWPPSGALKRTLMPHSSGRQKFKIKFSVGHTLSEAQCLLPWASGAQGCRERGWRSAAGGDGAASGRSADEQSLSAPWGPLQALRPGLAEKRHLVAGGPPRGGQRVGSKGSS